MNFSTLSKPRITQIRARLRGYHLGLETRTRMAKFIYNETKNYYAERYLKINDIDPKYTNRIEMFKVQHEAEKNAVLVQLNYEMHELKRNCRYAILARAFFDGKRYKDVEHSCRIKVDIHALTELLMNNVNVGLTRHHWNQEVEKWLGATHLVHAESNFPCDSEGTPL